ncbi:MAG: gluconate 2-dehydrogenase subunit 3 family protein [Bacteroidales bacterium]|nr:gluconate 2-dehydrogenase subunit 3 family protein [Bacteroidales bacterium]
MKQKNKIPGTAGLPVKIKLYSPKMQRRVFVKSLFACGLLTQIPFLPALKGSPYSNPYKTKTGLLNNEQMEIIREVQQQLFPADGNGPGAAELNADKYLLWVLSDPRKDPADTKYIIDGIGWVAETADEEFEKAFKQLSAAEKETLVAFIAKQAWGASWMSIILTYVFEALIADPQYGGNVDGEGWKWLGHFPGYPRPTADILYGNILKAVNTR